MKKKVAKYILLELYILIGCFKSLDCDACGSIIGVILSQEGKLIELFSKKLNDSRKKNLVYVKDVYTIVQALKKWRHHSIPREFVVY